MTDTDTPRPPSDLVRLRPDKMVDYEQWALDLCALLDEIEKHQEDGDKLRALLRFRFDLARKHSMVVIFDGSGQVGTA